MKTKMLVLLPWLALLAGCTGCSLMPVPSTEMHFQIGSTHLSWVCPKQFTATNIVASVNTNGTASIAVGSVASLNDPAVVDKAYAGQALIITAMGQQIVSGIQAGGALAGSAAGAAIKAP